MHGNDCDLVLDVDIELLPKRGYLICPMQRDHPRKML